MDVHQLTTKQWEELIEDLLALKDVVPTEESCPPEEEEDFCVAWPAISAPRLLVNKFTVLTIEDSNTIDSELVDALPLTPLIPAPLHKPKWERRLPKLLSISALDT